MPDAITGPNYLPAKATNESARRSVLGIGRVVLDG
jgi:hypothetical protein